MGELLNKQQSADFIGVSVNKFNSLVDKNLISPMIREGRTYRFSKKDLYVYNPCSVLNALANLEFEDYWFETATPTFLINLLQQTSYELPAIEGLEVSRAVFNTFDIEKLRPEALLFQTGYLQWFSKFSSYTSPR